MLVSLNIPSPESSLCVQCSFIGRLSVSDRNSMLDLHRVRVCSCTHAHARSGPSFAKRAKAGPSLTSYATPAVSRFCKASRPSGPPRSPFRALCGVPPGIVPAFSEVRDKSHRMPPVGCSMFILQNRTPPVIRVCTDILRRRRPIGRMNRP